MTKDSKEKKKEKKKHHMNVKTSGKRKVGRLPKVSVGTCPEGQDYCGELKSVHVSHINCYT
jgi:hypothetical protein